MAGILVDILFVIILFINLNYFSYLFYLLFYLFQSTVVIDYTLTNDNS